MNTANWCKNSTRLDMTGWEGDPLGIMQEIEIWPYYEMVYIKTRIHPGE